MLVLLGALSALFAVAAVHDIKRWRRRRQVNFVDPHDHGYQPPPPPAADFVAGAGAGQSAGF